MSRRALATTLALCLAGTLLPTTAIAADPDAPRTLTPIGGGYSTESLQGFAHEVIDNATGATVDLYVIPSSYGDDPADREENLRLAQQRTDQIEAVCDGVVDRAQFPGGCEGTLLPLLAREDALDPAHSGALADPETDGVYVLGGDQVLAMHVLANTPAEANLATAYAQGVVVGGTSAGNAVESRSMGAGYPAPGYPENALERDMSLIFWGDDLASEERGLSFGLQDAILDQHFYERGRFGRLLSWTGQSVARYGDPGKLGIGVDWGTAPVIEDEQRIVDVFGASSVTLQDMSRATGLDWVGPRDTLSVQDVLTHLVAPGTGVTYDIGARTAYLDGVPVPVTGPTLAPDLAVAGRAPLWLGGGDNDSADSQPLAELVAAAQAGTPGRSPGKLVVITAGYPDQAAVDAAAAAYADAVRELGWRGRVDVVPVERLTPGSLRGVQGALFVGGDQSLMGEEVADSDLRRVLAGAVGRIPVLTDGAATAVMGERYVPAPDPTTQDESIEEFMVDGVDTAPALGIVEGVTLEPMLTREQRWGRLYGAAHDDPALLSVGVSEMTALQLDASGGEVVGERSVITLDGASTKWLAGSNRALGAVNAWMDVFGPGDEID
ncbi:Type 1 glutamine amidotransferase-like domain-containing protein [Ornithinimicrobium panacihumi]|uniref:Type 1 glutamine amidotransferase-like domain-containing protein n=1 Tax=Ornithinimicrobium panacihumi TaxID=2008449 RepID=UPI003F89B06D